VRLALAVADAQRETYADGVWWVELAAVSDPDLVASVVAQTLGITFTEQKPALQALATALAEQHTLIVLDNCEHVLDAVSALSEAILRHCARVRLLVTSQESIKLPGEQAYRVPSLAVPAQGDPVAPDMGAVALFIARAQEADPRTKFDAKSLEATAAICRALDGIPLAIELAAARVPLLGVEGLQQRLSERFKVLTAGSRRVLQRHQTLRAALDWSYELLEPSEQLAFARMSVFAGVVPRLSYKIINYMIPSVIRSDRIAPVGMDWMMHQILHEPAVISAIEDQMFDEPRVIPVVKSVEIKISNSDFFFFIEK
jgi:predicted ATPase